MRGAARAEKECQKKSFPVLRLDDGGARSTLNQADLGLEEKHKAGHPPHRQMPIYAPCRMPLR